MYFNCPAKRGLLQALRLRANHSRMPDSFAAFRLIARRFAAVCFVLFAWKFGAFAGRILMLFDLWMDLYFIYIILFLKCSFYYYFFRLIDNLL